MSVSEISAVPPSLTRADVAKAMVDVVCADLGLAAAITVNEAWSSGYIARLLTHAEVIAAQSLTDDPLGPEPCSADAAVRRALDAANPRQVLDHCNAPIHDDARQALVELLQAQERFQRAAEHLERRGLRRTALPD